MTLDSLVTVIQWAKDKVRKAVAKLVDLMGAPPRSRTTAWREERARQAP